MTTITIITMMTTKSSKFKCLVYNYYFRVNNTYKCKHNIDNAKLWSFKNSNTIIQTKLLIRMNEHKCIDKRGKI